jgi:hypothetical protein
MSLNELQRPKTSVGVIRKELGSWVHARWKDEAAPLRFGASESEQYESSLV